MQIEAKDKEEAIIARRDFTFLDKPDPLKFFERQPLYEDLCREVKYILRKLLKREGIAVGIITSRVKSYKSYVDKLGRTPYNENTVTIRDRAGIRVVYLYKSDLPRIEKIIEKGFINVVKKKRSITENPGQFGYSDVKFYVELQRQLGPRYDDLKGLVCEIQVRTVGQDAWALISRDLVYNKEAQIPKRHQRALNRFVGLFELADEQFDAIRLALQQERKEIMAKNEEQFLRQPINLDTLIAFSQKYLPPSNFEFHREDFAHIVDHLHELSYSDLRDLHKAVKNSPKVLEYYESSEKMFPLSLILDSVLVSYDKHYRERFAIPNFRFFIDLLESGTVGGKGEICELPKG